MCNKWSGSRNILYPREKDVPLHRNTEENGKDNNLNRNRICTFKARFQGQKQEGLENGVETNLPTFFLHIFNEKKKDLSIG